MPAAAPRLTESAPAPPRTSCTRTRPAPAQVGPAPAPHPHNFFQARSDPQNLLTNYQKFKFFQLFSLMIDACL